MSIQRPESSKSDNSEKKFCAYCKGNNGRYGSHNSEDCNFIKNVGGGGPVRARKVISKIPRNLMHW